MKEKYGCLTLNICTVIKNFINISTVSRYILLYNVLPINRYTGNITIKCHSRSMGDNRDPTVVLHQEISSLPVNIASDTRCF